MQTGALLFISLLVLAVTPTQTQSFEDGIYSITLTREGMDHNKPYKGCNGFYLAYDTTGKGDQERVFLLDRGTMPAKVPLWRLQVNKARTFFTLTAVNQTTTGPPRQLGYSTTDCMKTPKVLFKANLTNKYWKITGNYNWPRNLFANLTCNKEIALMPYSPGYENALCINPYNTVKFGKVLNLNWLDNRIGLKWDYKIPSYYPVQLVGTRRLATWDLFAHSMSMLGNKLAAGGYNEAHIFEKQAKSGEWKRTLLPRYKSFGVINSRPASPGNWKRFVRVALTDKYVACGVPEPGHSVVPPGKVLIYSLANVKAPPAEFSSPGASSHFALSVSASGSMLAVADDGYLDGTPATDFNNATGRVSIFTMAANGTWSLTHQILNPDPAKQKRFGFSVALYGNTLAVSSIKALTPPFDENNKDPGIVNIYELSGGSWNLQANITVARDGGNNFWISDPGNIARVALFKNTLAVGYRLTNGGEVAIYNRNSAGKWVAALKQPLTEDVDVFGHGLVLPNESRLVVNSYFEKRWRGTTAEGAFVYDKVGGVWNKTGYVEIEGWTSGSAVAASGEMVALLGVGSTAYIFDVEASRK